MHWLWEKLKASSHRESKCKFGFSSNAHDKKMHYPLHDALVTIMFSTWSELVDLLWSWLFFSWIWCYLAGEFLFQIATLLCICWSFQAKVLKYFTKIEMLILNFWVCKSYYHHFRSKQIQGNIIQHFQTRGVYQWPDKEYILTFLIVGFKILPTFCQGGGR